MQWKISAKAVVLVMLAYFDVFCPSCMPFESVAVKELTLSYYDKQNPSICHIPIIW